MHQNIELKFFLAHLGGVWPCDFQLTFLSTKYDSNHLF